jgi:hypothetical protein
LHTNGLDLPKHNRLHKVQHPVTPDAPGFLEALDALVIPPALKQLCNNCLTPTKPAFFISATAHLNVISQACGLTTEEMIKMRGWVFLKTKSSDRSPCRHQTFSNSSMQGDPTGGGNVPTNHHANMTSAFPSALEVPSRETLKKKGHTEEPLLIKGGCRHQQKGHAWFLKLLYENP